MEVISNGQARRSCRPSATLRRAVVLALALGGFAAQTASGAEPERGVHRFVEVALSPDGTTVASVEGDAPPSGAYPVVRQLRLRSVDGRKDVEVVLPCGASEQCWPSSLAWSPDSQSLAFALRMPGSHARSLYSVGREGTGVNRFATFDGTIQALRYRNDGRLFMLAVEGARKEVGATEAGAPVTGDVEAPLEQRIATLDGDRLAFVSPADLFVYQYDLTPDGGFVGVAAPGDGDSNWWTAKLYRFSGSGVAKVLFAPPDNRHQIADPRVSPDGRSVAFISGLMSDFGSTGGDIYVAPVTGGAAANRTPRMQASARSIAWSCDGRVLANLLAGPETRLVTMDAGGAAPPTTLWSGQESLLDGEAPFSQSCASGATAVVHETFNRPPEIEVGEPGAWHDLTRSNAGLTMPLTARSLIWKNDGLTVQGWLLMPPGRAGKRLLIVSVHGGPSAAAAPTFYGPGRVSRLLDRGYALLLPNPRGSFGQGEAFTAANVRDLGHGDLRDILAGVDAAEGAAPIDDGRLGITGGSYGGFMTMWAVTQTHRFKAGVAAAGISDWMSYYGENGIDQWLLPFFGASAYDDPAIYARSSPIDFIRNAKTPVFAYVGAQDIECPSPQTQEFWHALRDLGTPTSLAIYPGEGHALRDPVHLADAERRTLDWFDRYLK